ncbi:MOSC domain-containing protein [Phototrophicus methaneseepsis]|uniref:MOSC domain-containing protein n=1 Tax=Phototrophicus methaneseepsis TaxID=2710758 RepID=A0A7S8EBF9_9CHLR|nr:MOSC domain-containing protein [Phototrophicus methaneseepsis]QPC83844.1 MOSC domain-containing protein [Phototrophicus methaneseepsis]
MPEVHSLVYQPAKTIQKPPYAFNRQPAEALNLIAGQGIEGDYKAGRNPRRQLNIVSREQFDALAETGWRTAPGEMGEQITLSGIDLEALPAGTRLQIGDQAIVEVIALREPCDWLARVQGRNHHDVEGKVGVMAGVVESGTIKVGDTVQVVLAEKAE